MLVNADYRSSLRAKDPPTSIACIEIDPVVVQHKLDGAVLHMLTARGFEVLDVVDEIGASPSPHSLRYLVVVCDPFPWLQARSVHPRMIGTDNHRLAAIAAVESWLRSFWMELEFESAAGVASARRSLLQTTKTTQEALGLLENLFGQIFLEKVVALARDEAATARPQWPILRSLGGGMTSARTDLVQFDGQLAVCRTFKRGRQAALEIELACYRLSDRIEGISPMLHHEENSIIIPFLKDYVSCRAHGIRRLSIRQLRNVFQLYRTINEYGVALSDYGPENVMVSLEDGSIRAVDFEHAYIYPREPLALQDTPLMVGRDFYRRLRSCGPRGPRLHPTEPAWVRTYADWDRYVLLEINELLSHGSDRRLAFSRSGRRMRQRCKNAMHKASLFLSGGSALYRHRKQPQVS